MTLKNFTNLSEAKKETIDKALLKEFSHYSVKDAQVARIIKDAGISRGSFYNYFADLPDAYQHIFMKAMADIHHPLKKDANATEVAQEVQEFVGNISNSPYKDLIKMHYQFNYHELATSFEPKSELQWAQMLLVHTTIKEILMHPNHQLEKIERLKHVLEKLEA